LIEETAGDGIVNGYEKTHRTHLIDIALVRLVVQQLAAWLLIGHPVGLPPLLAWNRQE
jgi:hypothetical protein